MCAIPFCPRKGVGTQTLQYMLSVCSDWKRITLITPAGKEQDVKFYTGKCGFHIGHKQMGGNVEVLNFYKEQ